MPNLRSSQKALIGDLHVVGIQLGSKNVTPNIKWPLATVPSISQNLDRSLFTEKEQRLSRDLVTLSRLANDMRNNPDSEEWGWFGDQGWFREEYPVPYNARIQENVSTLAWFYTQNRAWNPYYGSSAIAERLIAGLRYHVGLQHPDGGFGTQSPVDANPATTGFGLGHLAVVYQLLEASPIKPVGWSDYWKGQVMATILKAIDWVLDENNDVSWVNGAFHSNQLIGGLAGAARIENLLPSSVRTKLNQAVVRIQTLCISSAGYMYENYGPDFGYTLGVGYPYVGALYTQKPSQGLADMVQKNFEFMSYNALLEPGDLGYILNDAISTRTRSKTHGHSRTDEGGALDSMGDIRTGAPKANAFLTSRETKAAQRADWAASSNSVTQLPKGSFTPQRIQRILDNENLPTDAERAAAIAALPYIASTAFTEYRRDTREGEKFNRHYLYVRRPSYYTGIHWGYRADGVRVGNNMLYHPQTGTFIAGQGNSNTNWGLFTDAGGYSDTRVVSYSTTSTIPTGASNFTLNLQVANSASERTISYRTNDIGFALVREGAFWERLPLVLWPSGSQTGDVVTFSLAAGGTQTAGEETVTVNATAVTITRAGLGTMTVTLDQARSVTLMSTTETDAEAYFSSSRRQVRHLDIASTGSLGYTVAITLA